MEAILCEEFKVIQVKNKWSKQHFISKSCKQRISLVVQIREFLMS